MDDTVDVVIVGAGIAGLTCARRLEPLGVEARVLEASGRVGGRVHGYAVDGRAVQLGGRWTGPTQDRLAALATELGFAKVENRSFDDRTSPDHPLRESFVGLVRRLDTLAQTVSLEAPWKTPSATALDAQTLRSWLDHNASTEDATQAADTLAGFLPEAQDVSLLHALFYLRSNGGFHAILGLDDELHDSEMIDGGAHRLTNALAAGLNQNVRLDSPVHAIVQADDTVIARSVAGDVEARFAIVALPPTLAGRLHYEPAMPPDRDYLTQRMPIRGKVVVALLFETPFWRAEGRHLFVDENLSLWDEGGEHAPFSLSALVSIRRSREVGRLDEAARKHAVLRDVEKLVGPAVWELSSYHEMDWAAAPWSRGCNSFLTTGVWTAWGHALREPVGRIHWAGAEYSPRFVGQMDGAVRSAEHTVASIAEQL